MQTAETDHVILFEVDRLTLLPLQPLKRDLLWLLHLESYRRYPTTINHTLQQRSTVLLILSRL